MSRSAEDVVTSEEAFNFLQNVLGMSSATSKLKDSPQAFLQDLIRAWMHHIPWQTVTGIATPHQDRRLPTIADIKRDMMSGMGGLCYQHNVFCCLLLRALGFDASLIACDIVVPSDHAAVIVHHLTSTGSLHFVDLGSGTPMLRAVPLDFQDESPVYHDSFLRYKFSRQNDVISCFHWVECHVHRPVMDEFGDERLKDGWCNFITIYFKVSLEPSYFIPSMTPIFTKADKQIFFLSSIRCLAVPDGRFVCIKDTTLLQEKEPGRLSKSYFKSRKEIKDAFARYFPQFTEAVLETAFNDDFVEFDYDKGNH